jgi:hypothetical protein
MIVVGALVLSIVSAEIVLHQNEQAGFLNPYHMGGSMMTVSAVRSALTSGNQKHVSSWVRRASECHHFGQLRPAST